MLVCASYCILIIFKSGSNTEDSQFQKSDKTNWLKDLVKKAPFKINNTYALVFYGRKAQTSILLRYLHKNLKVNGGILEKIVFAVKTNNKEDLEYLDSILNENKIYYQKIVFTADRLYRDVYLGLYDDDLIFKIDDDIVFMGKDVLENMLEEYITNDLLFLSANVVNHPLLSHVHARMMTMSPYYLVNNFTYVKADNVTDLDTTECKYGEYNSFGMWLKNGKCTGIVHENFLDHALRNNLKVYEFNKWDFHQMGYERWSINFVLMRGKYVNKMNTMFPDAYDDEFTISVLIPKMFGKHSYALGSAIVVHFSYITQSDFLKQTNLLQKYDDLSLKLID